MNQITEQIPKAFFDLAKDAVEAELDDTSRTKKDIWTKMGNELEISGYPKTDIARKIHTTIEEQLEKKTKSPARVDNAHFYSVMLKHKWYTQRTTIDSSLENNGNSSINTRNKEVIECLKYTKEIINLMFHKLKDSDEIINTKSKDGKYLIQQWKQVLANCEAAFDDKRKVTTNTELILVSCLTTEMSTTRAAKSYMEKRVKLLSEQDSMLSKKQASKFLNRSKITLPILKPHNRDMAVFLGYLGQQCICGTWNTVYESGKGKCLECNKVFTINTISKCRWCQGVFYTEDIPKLKRTGRCVHESCLKEITLPKVMA